MSATKQTEKNDIRKMKAIDKFTIRDRTPGGKVGGGKRIKPHNLKGRKTSKR